MNSMHLAIDDHTDSSVRAKHLLGRALVQAVGIAFSRGEARLYVLLMQVFLDLPPALLKVEVIRVGTAKLFCICSLFVHVEGGVLS